MLHQTGSLKCIPTGAHGRKFMQMSHCYHVKEAVVLQQITIWYCFGSYNSYFDSYFQRAMDQVLRGILNVHCDYILMTVRLSGTSQKCRCSSLQSE